mmetsp:Transcript_12736/g.18382  ORF Transcript_12736/g.18382 Transcript_12736/m.18382 type:complete len:95 (+) Transcript_12736:107-391(+)
MILETNNVGAPNATSGRRRGLVDAGALLPIASNESRTTIGISYHSRRAKRPIPVAVAPSVVVVAKRLAVAKTLVGERRCYNDIGPQSDACENSA